MTDKTSVIPKHFPSTPYMTSPQVTIVWENSLVKKFKRNGNDSFQDFPRRVDEECTCRGVTTDNEKLAILNSRLCMDGDSFAGKIVKLTKFKDIIKFDEFYTALRQQLRSLKIRCATHVDQTNTYSWKNWTDIFKCL